MRKLIIWLYKWWYKRQRYLDLVILWPVCLAKAPDLDHAKAAFAIHAYHDPAWLILGEEQIDAFIDGLEGDRV